MPKCAKCTDILPPNFCSEIMGSDGDYMCLFCDNDITELTIKKPDNSVEKYTKKQCIKDYLKMMNYLKEQTKKFSEAKTAKSITDGGLILPGSQEFEDTLKGK